MSKYFTIEFNDLTFDKQQEMIADVKEQLLEDYEYEAKHGRFGKNFGREEYKGMSWQEACVREYSIDYILWEDEDARTFDWEFTLDNYAEEEARNICERAMTYNRIEVEIND